GAARHRAAPNMRIVADDAAPAPRRRSRAGGAARPAARREQARLGAWPLDRARAPHALRRRGRTLESARTGGARGGRGVRVRGARPTSELMTRVRFAFTNKSRTEAWTSSITSRKSGFV